MLSSKIRNIRLTSPLCRASVLSIIGAGLALSAASPASAERVIKCTGLGTSARCETVCRQQLANGNTVDYPEGTEMTVTDADGTKHKYSCKDGNWVQAARLTVLASGIVTPVEAIKAAPEATTSTPVQDTTVMSSPRLAR